MSGVAEVREGATLIVEYPLLRGILEDLEARFLSVLDFRSLTDSEVCFVLQKALWFYLDSNGFLIAKRALPRLRLETFGLLMLCSSEDMRRAWLGSEGTRRTGWGPVALKVWNEKFKDWLGHVNKIPRLGAILVNPAMTKVVMIKPYGYSSSVKHGGSPSYQFPKGKMRDGEQQMESAIREVREEIGFDITGYVSETRSVTAVSSKGVNFRLYIAYPVPESVKFHVDKNMKEVEDVVWVSLNDIPGWAEHSASGKAHHVPHSDGRYAGAVPFLKQLKSWIVKCKPERALAKSEKTPTKPLHGAGTKSHNVPTAGVPRQPSALPIVPPIALSRESEAESLTNQWASARLMQLLKINVVSPVASQIESMKQQLQAVSGFGKGVSVFGGNGVSGFGQGGSPVGSDPGVHQNLSYSTELPNVSNSTLFNSDIPFVATTELVLREVAFNADSIFAAFLSGFNSVAVTVA